MEKDHKKGIKNRILVVEILIFLLIILLCAKSIEVQVFKASRLSHMAKKDYLKQIIVNGDRGEIFDSNMNKLCTSVDALSLAASPIKIKHPVGTAKKLSSILGIKAKRLEKKFKTKRHFTWIKRRITPDQAEKIKKLKIDGIFFRKDSKRFYPNRNLAAQVMGFTGLDNNGLEGIEYKYNSLLQGKSQKFTIKKDGTGNNFNAEKKIKDKLGGNSLVLTIDRRIQFLSEKTLKKTVLKHNAKSGIAVVMKPETGELLAVAHYPEFNPNNFSNHDKATWKNRAVTDAFEPGSIMKIFTAATAIEKGLFTKKSIFYCEKGKYVIDGHTINDSHPRGWLTLEDIIKYSSNIGAVKISQTLGRKTLHNHLAAFGFGQKTKIDCPYETSGNLIPYKRWSKVDTGAIAFGQGISASAMQIITGVCAVANDGILMKPMLVKKILSSTGDTIKVFNPTPINRVISESTAKTVKEIMLSVVEEEGTGTKAAIDGYSVCGKTGTAQKANKYKKGYLKNKYIAVFTGFAPLDDPKLAVLVVVDEPGLNYYGGTVAAPAFKTIMTESFNYLSIPPDMQEEQMIAKISNGGEI